MGCCFQKRTEEDESGADGTIPGSVLYGWSEWMEFHKTDRWSFVDWWAGNAGWLSGEDKQKSMNHDLSNAYVSLQKDKDVYVIPYGGNVVPLLEED